MKRKFLIAVRRGKIVSILESRHRIRLDHLLTCSDGLDKQERSKLQRNLSVHGGNLTNTGHEFKLHYVSRLPDPQRRLAAKSQTTSIRARNSIAGSLPDRWHWPRVLLLLLLCFSLCVWAASPKLVVKNARIFTMAPQQREPFIGYLVVAQNGTIATVPAGNPPDHLDAEKVIDANGHWIVPGFISAHSHLWQAAYRGLATDKTLTSWIDDIYIRRAAKASPQDLYWFTLLGSLDHLQHGITAAYNLNYTRVDWSNGDSPFDKVQFHGEMDSDFRFVHG